MFTGMSCLGDDLPGTKGGTLYGKILRGPGLEEGGADIIQYQMDWSLHDWPACSSQRHIQGCN